MTAYAPATAGDVLELVDRVEMGAQLRFVGARLHEEGLRLGAAVALALVAARWRRADVGPQGEVVTRYGGGALVIDPHGLNVPRGASINRLLGARPGATHRP
jgi:hypothetical protein